MGKIFLIGLLGLGVLVGVFFVFNAYIYSEKQAENTYEPYRATLSGEYVCLPHKEQGEVQTTECAFGLKTDSGEYYAIDFGLMSQTPPEISLGVRFEASGVVTPIERLSSDHWRAYEAKGIFSVTNGFREL